MHYQSALCTDKLKLNSVQFNFPRAEIFLTAKKVISAHNDQSYDAGLVLTFSSKTRSRIDSVK